MRIPPPRPEQRPEEPGRDPAADEQHDSVDHGAGRARGSVTPVAPIELPTC